MIFRALDLSRQAQEDKARLEQDLTDKVRRGPPPPSDAAQQAFIILKRNFKSLVVFCGFFKLINFLVD